MLPASALFFCALRSMPSTLNMRPSDAVVVALSRSALASVPTRAASDERRPDQPDMLLGRDVSPGVSALIDSRQAAGPNPSGAKDQRDARRTRSRQRLAGDAEPRLPAGATVLGSWDIILGYGACRSSHNNCCRLFTESNCRGDTDGGICPLNCRLRGGRTTATVLSYSWRIENYKTRAFYVTAEL